MSSAAPSAPSRTWTGRVPAEQRRRIPLWWAEQFPVTGECPAHCNLRCHTNVDGKARQAGLTTAVKDGRHRRLSLRRDDLEDPLSGAEARRGLASGASGFVTGQNLATSGKNRQVAHGAEQATRSVTSAGCGIRTLPPLCAAVRTELPASGPGRGRD